MNEFVLFHLFFVLLGTCVGLKKNRPVLGFFLTFFLGIVGLFIIFLLDADGKVCRHCGNIVKPGFKVCGKCGRENN